MLTMFYLWLAFEFVMLTAARLYVAVPVGAKVRSEKPIVVAPTLPRAVAIPAVIRRDPPWRSLIRCPRSSGCEPCDALHKVADRGVS